MKMSFSSHFGMTYPFVHYLAGLALSSISLPSDLPIFGAPLELAIQRSLLGADGLELPTVFRECIGYLEEHCKLVVCLLPFSLFSYGPSSIGTPPGHPKGCVAVILVRGLLF